MPDELKPSCLQRQASCACQQLAAHCTRLPWQLQPADLQQHAVRIQAQGLAPRTTCSELGILMSFYRWRAGKALRSSPRGVLTHFSNSIIHARYACQHDTQDVVSVLVEGASGVDEENVGLHILSVYLWMHNCYALTARS